MPPPTAGLGAMPPPSQWERATPTVPGAELPPWGRLVLHGAARGWMVFAIVWGAILFLGQNVAQNVLVGHNNNNDNSALVQRAHIFVTDCHRSATSDREAPTGGRRACGGTSGHHLPTVRRQRKLLRRQSVLEPRCPTR